jgi:hypothetical protein
VVSLHRILPQFHWKVHNFLQIFFVRYASNHERTRRILNDTTIPDTT